MRRAMLIPLCLAAATAWPAITLADPWRDESGRGRGRGGDRPPVVVVPPPVHAPPPGYVPYDPPAVRAERIPRGHLPPPGECRVWIPGLPPGQQPPPHRC